MIGEDVGRKWRKHCKNRKRQCWTEGSGLVCRRHNTYDLVETGKKEPSYLGEAGQSESLNIWTPSSQELED